ncbi:MAG: pyruvate formate lyase family protein [Victivallales bacterium]|jgi:formate C-acetyltransferase
MKSTNKITYADNWTLFAPFVKEDGVPTAKDLTRIPLELVLNGKTARPQTIPGSERLDLVPFLGDSANGLTAFVYVELSSDQDGEAVIGIGADWWFQAWVDGKPLGNTLATGNGRNPVSSADHVCHIELCKGRHLLAIRFISGSGGSVLSVGDPAEGLRQRAEEQNRAEQEALRRLACLPDNLPPSRSLDIPGLPEPLALGLTPAQRHLRRECLVYPLRESFRKGLGMSPELTLIDAEAWATHTEQEPWIVWKARKFAARMRGVLPSIDACEHVLGKPSCLEYGDKEAKSVSLAREKLTISMPPHPGGDNGHFHPDYETVLAVGVGGLLERIRGYLTALRLDDSRRDFYFACETAMLGFGDYIRRMAAACEANATAKPGESAHWMKMAGVCAHVASEPPRTFHEALQLMQFVLFAVWVGEDHSQTSFGRLDQILYPFYRRDLVAGGITSQEAFELLCDAYIQNNRMQPAGGAIAVIVGGSDAEGNDLTNPLTYLCLAAREATRLVYPTVAIAWHRKSPRELMDFAVGMLAAGVGDPAFFNDELISAGLQAHGASRADSHNFMNSTCVEMKVVGASNIWVTAPYFNCPSHLLEVMRKAEDGDEPADFPSFCVRLRDRFAEVVANAAREMEETWKRRAQTGLQPFASCVIRDCLERGLDFDQGGARYNWVENSFVGLANLVDGLLAIKELVYERKELTLAKFHSILRNDYRGHEAFLSKVLNGLDKYGNNLETADRLAGEWTQFLMDTTESNTVGGHRYVPGFFCWVMHERLGSMTGATPDGRRAGKPFADGAGPAQGREHCGPTSAVLSTTSWSHFRAMGGVVHNLKFSPKVFADQQGRDGAKAVIETYLKRGGLEIQVNVVGPDALKEAQRHPELHPDLIVRVAGYSDYFVNLTTNMQEEVIARTEFNR